MRQKHIFFQILIWIFFCFPVSAFDINDGVEKLFQQESQSIVLIGAVHKSGSRLGSGFIVRSDGLIITNYHLIQNAQKMAVKLYNNRSYSRVQVLEVDPGKDLALIKIEARGLNAVHLGNSQEVSIGQRVVTIGNPLGFENTVADGLVSAWRKGDQGMKLLQISVPLSEGSSGSPLFNLDGEVIGVTTSSCLKGQNLNFAIPIQYVKQLMRRAEIANQYQKTSRPVITKRTSSSVATPLAFEKGQKVYTIQGNDTLYGLARKFDTSVKEIMVLNHLNTTRIYRGQKIRLPHK